jgi:mannose-6-phosphate isomerase
MAARPGQPAAVLAPIHLRASLHETLWGGRNLKTVCGKDFSALPESAAVGEAWETALDTVARNAPYAGRTLGELVETLGEGLLGARAIAVFGWRFPLLAKFIDAHQQLSVQVHPADRYAAAHEGGKLGKTETWYILHAEPGARLIYGIERAASREEVRAAIAANRLEDLLHSFEARPGDVIFVPAGTVHAIGGGILLYELQEYSDITYRLYDYGRLQPDGRPRALHVEPSLEVMRYTPPVADRAVPVTLAESPACTQRVLSACRYFVLEEARLRGEILLAQAPGSCQILSVLGGSCALSWAEPGTGGTLALALGETVVLPAALSGCQLSGEASIARSYVPEPDDASLRAWRAAQPAGFEGE